MKFYIKHHHWFRLNLLSLCFALNLFIHLLDFLKTSIDEFTQQLQELPTDHQIVEWLMKRTPKNEHQIEQYNQELVDLGPQNTRSWSFLHDRIQQLDSIISTRNDVETFFDLMVLSDQKAFQFP